MSAAEPKYPSVSPDDPVETHFDWERLIIPAIIKIQSTTRHQGGRDILSYSGCLKIFEKRSRKSTCDRASRSFLLEVYMLLI